MLSARVRSGAVTTGNRLDRLSYHFEHLLTGQPATGEQGLDEVAEGKLVLAKYRLRLDLRCSNEQRDRIAIRRKALGVAECLASIGAAQSRAFAEKHFFADRARDEHDDPGEVSALVIICSATDDDTIDRAVTFEAADDRDVIDR
ncbi:hypothetical protein [Bradyrhizobium elkanii]|uniref:hypothetical protein n=1 Tax=Bradyrhizobium elkanii TaxID=29448 RepID=UPI00101F999F|nr:hypothetical protein [Bradyrhizobium elkanii]MCP1732005.1 hypothetical protein [Bradyrhizobium elkanii]MCS3567339.1 hypothetical protein [Bradyrhizobium elkanii]MCS3591176.1 hypothetical protein [Bradyrhizobium elkanii]MCS3620619.1 hypothetical protein [Bradyrhizobium elkanii]MCW2111208.1 hypothetical protein [Bradyrhizobium elkanii]